MSDERLTDDELVELEALCERATPGPWSEGQRTGAGVAKGDYDRLVYPATHGAPVCALQRPGARWKDDIDMAFIIAARTALPRALAELRSARAQRTIIWRGSGRDLATDVIALLTDYPEEKGRFLDSLGFYSARAASAEGGDKACLCWCCSINQHSADESEGIYTCGHPCDKRLQPQPTPPPAPRFAGEVLDGLAAHACNVWCHGDENYHRQRRDLSRALLAAESENERLREVVRKAHDDRFPQCRTDLANAEAKVAALEAQLAEARAEITTDDKLLADRDALLDEFPCPVHGRCIPHVSKLLRNAAALAERNARLVTSILAAKTKTWPEYGDCWCYVPLQAGGMAAFEPYANDPTQHCAQCHMFREVLAAEKESSK